MVSTYILVRPTQLRTQDNINVGNGDIFPKMCRSNFYMDNSRIPDILELNIVSEASTYSIKISEKIKINGAPINIDQHFFHCTLYPAANGFSVKSSGDPWFNPTKRYINKYSLLLKFSTPTHWWNKRFRSKFYVGSRVRHNTPAKRLVSRNVLSITMI